MCALALRSLALFILLTSLAAANTPLRSSPPQGEEVMGTPVQMYKVHIDGSFPIHQITDEEWERRGQFGIPEQARKCSEHLFAFERPLPSRPVTIVGIFLVLDNGSVRPRSMEQLFFFDIFPEPMLVYGSVTFQGVVTVLNGAVMLPRSMARDIQACTDGQTSLR